MDLKKFNADLKFGNEGEKLIISKVNKLFNVYKTKNKFAFFDYRDDDNKIDFELKTRRIYKGQYPTIFFAKHKLESGKEKKKVRLKESYIYFVLIKNPIVIKKFYTIGRMMVLMMGSHILCVVIMQGEIKQNL
jgi:hypothetical protein